MITMKRVLLLKAAKQESAEDIYVQSLSKQNYDVTLCSPLSFKFTNLEEFGASLQQPSLFSGIIFSSPRTVQAVQHCVQNNHCGLDDLQDWKPLKAYCVGQATANAIRSDLGLIPVGEDSGNATNLVKIIIDGTEAGSKPLLFPCGTLRRETIPESLQNAGVKYKAHVVYDTVPHPDLEVAIDQYFEQGSPDIIMFFSPSGVRFTKDYLSKYKSSFSQIKLVAIGPTTKVAMEEIGYTVSCTSEKPTPASLIGALQTLMDT